MSAIDCACESDVVLAVQTGRWPRRVDDDLRRHVSTCTVCADAVLVTQAVAEMAAMDDETEGHDLHLPGSGAVWLRAEMRARAEASRTATRPITLVQVAAFTCVAAVGGALFGATSGWFQAWIGHIWTALVAIDIHALPAPTPLVASLTEHAVLVGIIAAFALLAPVAVYLVARED
jgi:hypothetical protein